MMIGAALIGDFRSPNELSERVEKIPESTIPELLEKLANNYSGGRIPKPANTVLQNKFRSQPAEADLTDTRIETDPPDTRPVMTQEQATKKLRKRKKKREEAIQETFSI